MKNSCALICLSLLIMVWAGSCGSGGNGGGGGNQNSPGYTLAANPTAVSVNPGAGTSLAVGGQPLNGFTGTVGVSLTGLPAGVMASPATFSLSGYGTQQVQLTADASAIAGKSTVTVSGSGTGVSPSTQFQLTVNGPPAISLALQPSSLSLIPGVQQAVQISVNGVNGFNQLVSGTIGGLPAGVTVNSSTFSVFPGGTATIYFTAAAGAASGMISVNASSGLVSAAAQLPISINTTPDFQLTTGTNNSLAISQNASEQPFSLSAVGYNGFSQPISVSFSGVPAGVSFSPATFTLQPGGAAQTVTLTSTFSAVPTNGATVNVAGSAGGITHQIQLNLSVLAAALSLTLQPTSLTVAAGSTNSFELQLSNLSVGAPNGTISLQISGVPSGVTVTPATYTAPSQGVGLNVYVTAASTGAVGGTLTVTATYGPVQTKATMPIVIGPKEAFTPVPLTTADQLIRVDTLTPYYGFPPPNYTVYHAATQRFFVTEANLGRLYVVDATKKGLAGTINIPGAFGMDQAPDGSVLYVATLLGDLYVVDPVQLTIVKRYPSSSISPYGFPANAVYALADGKLILENYFIVPGYSWIDGNGPIAVWDPKTNNITVYGQGNGGYNGGAPQAPTCFAKFENVMLTNNRTRVLMAQVLTSEGSSQLCSLDPEAGTWNVSPAITGGSNSALTTLALTPDGNTLYAYDGYKIYALDPATFAVKTSFAATAVQGAASFAPIAVLLVSADQKSVFLTDPNGADVFDQYDVTTGSATGWLSQLNMTSPGSYTEVQPMYQAIAPNGLAAGVIPGGGIGLLDTTAVHALPVGSRFTQAQLSDPYGPVSGGTVASWLPNIVGVPVPPLGSIYFNSNAATSINNDGFTGILEAVSPSGKAGPVDVRTFTTDGASQLLPDGFSYGPWVLEGATSYSTAEGGGTGELFGYGFGPQLYTGGSLYLKPPSDTQVTVGGAAATVTGFSPNPYGLTYFTAPIFPSNALQYTIPPGTAGTSSAIGVANSSGETTSTQQMNYLPALAKYPVAGQLADGIYDKIRDVYYFSDANQVRVFSLTQNSWLPSIAVPAPQGASGSQRLIGMGISPDSTRLAVADAGAQAIDVINLDQPSSVQIFPYTPQNNLYGVVPTAVAFAGNSTVYIANSDLNGDGGCGFMKRLELGTGNFTEVGPAADGNCLSTNGGLIGISLAASADGSRIFFDDAGLLGFVDTASGQFTIANNNGYYNLDQGGSEVAICISQPRVFIDGIFADSNLNATGLEVLNTAESINAGYVSGSAFSADGSLFFQAGFQAIDVFDGATGMFRSRIALPIILSPNFRALVSNGKDNRIVAITGSNGDGIAVVDLSTLPEPVAVSWFSELAPISNVSLPSMSTRKSPMLTVHRTTSKLLLNRTKPRR